MQKTFVGLIALIQFTGCAAYRVASTDAFEAQAPIIQEHLRGHAKEAISVVKLNEFPEGAHCFEPLLYVLSLGIVPTHCVDRYHVSMSPTAHAEEEGPRTDFEVTAMQGWIALFLPLSPRWKFGYGDGANEEIRHQISTD